MNWVKKCVGGASIEKTRYAIAGTGVLEKQMLNA